jgi:hypothetical protein
MACIPFLILARLTFTTTNTWSRDIALCARPRVGVEKSEQEIEKESPKGVHAGKDQKRINI